jgi:hypothetical protein
MSLNTICTSLYSSSVCIFYKAFFLIVTEITMNLDEVQGVSAGMKVMWSFSYESWCKVK